METQQRGAISLACSGDGLTLTDLPQRPLSVTSVKHTGTCAAVDAGIWDGANIQSYPLPNRVGEAPCWHPVHQCLYWIDVRSRQLLKLCPLGINVERWDLPEVVGALGICVDNQVCLALTRRLVKLDLHTGKLQNFALVENEPAHNRLNDGKVSTSSRWFVFGSMNDRLEKHATHALYRASTAGQVQQLHVGLTVCNGIAWNLASTRLYFSNSAAGVIYHAR